MSLSRVVSVQRRRHDLGMLFVNLLRDESRWVRMAAFQALGPFISTFTRPQEGDTFDDEDAGGAEMLASPSLSSLGAGDVSADDEACKEAEVDADYNSFCYWRDPLPELVLVEAVVDVGEQPQQQADLKVDAPVESSAPEPESVSDSVEKALEDLMARVELGGGGGEESVAATPETVHAFDLRRVACQELVTPPPTSAPALPPADAATNDLSAVRMESAATSASDSEQQLATNKNQFQSNLVLPPAYVKSAGDGGVPSAYNSWYKLLPSRPRSSQNIVPHKLMDFYLQMTDPYYVETVDAEITRHCAYSLPAVVSTLGKEHWPLLRDLYGLLASDMQWKVRRTLASSLHEVGGIVGQEVVTSDLLPVFDGFMKDLDEVRVGVLKHLGDFLRLLPDQERRACLPRLSDFLKLDNEQNWRFRQELALQLHAVVGLFSPADTAQSILPLALTLAADRVAAVRLPAFTLVTNKRYL